MQPNVVMERYLTERQQAQLLGTLRKHAAVLARRDYAWIRLLMVTGLRVGEFSRMCLRDARFALETGWLFIPAEHRKGRQGERRDHRVPVTQPVRECLQALIAIHADMGGGEYPERPLVFSRKHRLLSVRAYQERMAHWCAEAGIEHASPHWLRHTRAMNLMRRTTAANPLGIVQAALGHASVASTGVYTRVSKEELQRALEEVDGPARVRPRHLRKLYAELRVADADPGAAHPEREAA